MAVLILSRNQRLMSIEAGTMPSIEVPMPASTPRHAWNCQISLRCAAMRQAEPSNTRPSG
jgi:hypothetical protein